MSEKSPEELDKLFQQGSEQYDFEYNAEAWGQMEGLLEKDDRRRVLWWWLAGLGLLFVMGGIWFFSADTSINNLPAVDIKQTSGDESHQSDKEKNVFIPVQESPREASQQEDIDNKIKNTSSRTKTLEGNINNLETILIEESVKSKVRKTSRPIASTASNALKKRPSVTMGNKAISLVNSIIEDNSATSNNPRNLVNDISLLPLLAFQLSTKDVPAELPEVIFSREADINNSKSAQILIGLVLAGEVSAVHSRNFSSLDGKIGVQLEYRYKQKYSTSIGANYIRKKYNASEGDYIPPRGFWTRMIAPQATSAITTVLEIPIMVGYFPKGYARNGFYSNIGLTSFFMLREKYQYSYDLPDPDLIREWGTQNTNRHWFGIGQISVGYQYFSNPKTTFQVAPYLQIPLTGIGHGQVKLWSIGLNLKMNFQVY